MLDRGAKKSVWLEQVIGDEDGSNLQWIRVRDGVDGIESFIPSRSYPHCIWIDWQFGDDAQFEPTADQTRQMAEFEKAITEALTDKPDPPNTWFVASLRGGGIRRWVGYCRDVEAFEDLFNDALDDQPDFPLGISVDDDPDWQNHKSLLSDAKESLGL